MAKWPKKQRIISNTFEILQILQITLQCTHIGWWEFGNCPNSKSKVKTSPSHCKHKTTYYLFVWKGSLIIWRIHFQIQIKINIKSCRYNMGIRKSILLKHAENILVMVNIEKLWLLVANDTQPDIAIHWSGIELTWKTSLTQIIISWSSELYWQLLKPSWTKIAKINLGIIVSM